MGLGKFMPILWVDLFKELLSKINLFAFSVGGIPTLTEGILSP